MDRNEKGKKENVSSQPAGDSDSLADSFSDTIGRKAARKIKARASTENAWFGLGMMGLVGWSVTVPTILGVAAGIWLDNRHPGKISWTLTLLITGLMIGCLNAWYWVAQQNAHMQEDNDE
jgi:ATP synthase protein I